MTTQTGFQALASVSERAGSASGAAPVAVESPFGSVLTAMVSPFQADGSLDLHGAARLAEHLVVLGNDGIVVNGTTGESPTTTDAEKRDLVRAVVEAVGDRAVVVAGCGTNSTAHSVELARQAEAAGAQGLLAVTPYYSKPPQEGVIAHFQAIADATELPVMLYDIPGRTGIPLEPETLLTLAAHPRIAAVKDAKGDLESAVDVIRQCGLRWYSGDDGLNLPFLAVGAVGFVSVTGHLVADRLAGMLAAFRVGDIAQARTINESLQPVSTGLFRTQGAILTKAALNLIGLPAGPMRLPLVAATAAQVEVLRRDLAAGAVPGFTHPG